jgi:phosphoglycolate phosphatase
MSTTTTRRRTRDDPAAVARLLINTQQSDHDGYDAIVFDCDGVLWRGDELIDGAAALLNELQRRDIPYLFFTNNSLRSRADYALKFAKLGLGPPLVTAERIISSSFAAAHWLHRQASTTGTPIKTAYVLGGQGIIDELKLVAGIDAFGGPQDADKRADFTLGRGAEVAIGKDVGAVVVGVDPLLSYWKIHYAAQCLLQNPHCLFVACNEDSRGHFTPGQEWPGAGASVAAVAAVIGKAPDVVVGKPNPYMMDSVMDGLVGGSNAAEGRRRPRVLMVGDRLDTDVAWAHAASRAISAADGVDEEEEEVEKEEVKGPCRRPRVGALLVMSGVATDEDLEAWKGEPPDHVLSGVWELGEALKAA